MTESELREKIEIILSKRDGLGVKSFTFPQDRFENSNFFANPSSMVCEQIDLFCLPYNQCDRPMRLRFLDILLEYFGPGAKMLNGWIIFHVVFILYGFEPLKPFLEKPPFAAITAWTVLNQRLTIDSGAFSDEDIGSLSSISADVVEKDKQQQDSKHSPTSARESAMDQLLRRASIPYVADLVSKKIAVVRYLRLKHELFEGTNPEINSDKQVLLSRMTHLKFRPEIVSAFEALDLKIFQAGKPIEFKTCIDLVRTIYEEIVEDSARAVAVKKNLPVLTYTAPFQPWNLFLQNNHILTSEEADLTQKLYNYLSVTGTHRLGSEPEQVRVCRNTVVEICLLIAGRVAALS